MSLEYYLVSKKKYESIIENLESVIENFKDIFSYTAEFDMDEAEQILDVYNQRCYIENFRSKLKSVSDLKKLCDKKIKELCIHEFVNDTIDIDAERTQNITYCKICEYTLP